MHLNERRRSHDALGSTGPSDIFLSYASEDRDRVRPLVEGLIEHGWSVWWDRRIPPGMTWPEMIEQALSDTKAMVVVWTEASVNSKWVKIETSEGEDSGALVPVSLDRVKPPLQFRLIQSADLVGWDGSDSHPQFRAVVAQLERTLSVPARVVQERERQAEAKRKADEDAEAKRRADEAAEAQRKADEAAQWKRKAEEEALAKRKADEEAEAKRKADQEAAARRKADEEAAAKKETETEASAALVASRRVVVRTPSSKSAPRPADPAGSIRQQAKAPTPTRAPARRQDEVRRLAELILKPESLRWILGVVVTLGVLGVGSYFGMGFMQATEVAEPIASTEESVRARAQERFLSRTQALLVGLDPIPEVWLQGGYFLLPSEHGHIRDVWQGYLATIREVRAEDRVRYRLAYEQALDDAGVQAAEERSSRLAVATADFALKVKDIDAHWDRVEALSVAAVQSHDALLGAEGLVLYDATETTGRSGGIGAGTSGRDSDSQLLLDQVIDLLEGVLDSDGMGPREGANVREWVWGGFLDVVTR